MGKQKELKGIAFGILDTFISRNNDFHGYWGIGILYRHSVENGDQPVTLDLINKTISPPSPVLQEMAVHYGNLLEQRLTKREIPASKVNGCQIILNFNLTEIDRRTLPQTTHGSPYSCELQINLANGKLYQAKRFGWCDPHDPSREARSTRVDPGK